MRAHCTYMIVGLHDMTDCIYPLIKPSVKARNNAHPTFRARAQVRHVNTFDPCHVRINAQGDGRGGGGGDAYTHMTVHLVWHA